MLRLTACILIAVFLSTTNLNFGPPSSQSLSVLTRITNTPEQALNLNPALSDDGRTVVFESSANTLGGGGTSFQTFRTDLSGQAPSFVSIGSTRAVCPALSNDGRIIVFASMEDLVGQNVDRNSEIFLFDGLNVRQLTFTTPSLETTRLTDGSFQPSITSDGQTIVFSSNRNFRDQNADHSFEIFLYNVVSKTFSQLTNDTFERAARSPKISGDGTRVFYTRTSGETVADLVLIETQTLTSRVVVANVEDLSITEGRAASNDGMRLVYSALTAPNQSQVFVYEGRDDQVRQLTQLGSRSVDVKLQPTISGDGKRVAFATRRRVVDTSDGGVELYLLDLPTGEIQQITDAPSTATAEVVASLNFDGTLAAFNFPRIISGPVSDEDSRNNSEIYLASIAPRPEFGQATVLNAASHGREPATETNLALGSIATIRGNALAFNTEATAFAGDDPPFTVAGTSVRVNGQQARIFYAAPDEVVFVVPEASAIGPAEVVVTNADGFSSKAQASISHAAPGVFTVAGDGRGEAVILNSDTLMAGPFDPSNRPLRLSIFATGVRRANSVTVTIRGRSTIVERVAPAGLAGIDEIHVLVPSELSGAGSSTVIVTADGVRSNSTTVVLSGKVPTPSPTPSPSPSPSATPTPTPTPTPTATPTPTPTVTPIPTPSPTPSPTPTVTPTPNPSPSPVASTQVVISQIFGGGGNSGAPFRNDFIEIFNSGNTPVNLTGWSVQYASATASSWSVTPLTSVVLAPGQYYLVQEASGGSNGALLPTPDATGTIAMAAGSGKVVLVRNSTALTGTCPNEPNIVDMVGYGNTASCFRGSPAPAASNTNAILRAANGCTNTNSNAADFATGAPNPRNTLTPPTACEIATASTELFPRQDAKAQRKTSGGRRSELCAFATLREIFFRGG